MRTESRTRRPGLDDPGLVPSGLLPDPDADGSGRRPRSTQDWVVDVVGFVLAVGLGIVLFATAFAEMDRDPSLADRLLDYGVGGVGWLSLWWRRRWPVGVALLLLVPAAVAISSAVAVVIAIFTVGVHRPPRTTIAVAALHLVAVSVFAATHESPDSFAAQIAWSAAFYATVVAWSLFVRARRQLVMTLHERAERAEAEQRLHAEQARLAERARIAREMHDVLGHRISLIVLHAVRWRCDPTCRRSRWDTRPP